MIPHPAALDASYGRDVYRPLCRVTFVDPSGAPSAPVDVIDGSLNGNADAWPRWSARITVPTAVTPAKTVPPVSPYGGQVWIDMGARIRGVDTLFRVATLDVCQTEISRPEGRITINAVGRESRVAEYLDDNPDALSPAGKCSEIITALVSTAIPGLQVRNQLTPAQDVTYAAGAFRVGDNRWEAVEDVATATDVEAYFAHDGVLLIRATPQAASLPVMYLQPGDGGTLTGYRSVRGWAPNRVRVAYDDGTSRITGVWNATSGPLAAPAYGRHAWRDSLNVDPGKLPTATQANRHAATMSKRLAIAARSTELTCVPAPWLEPGDTVGVNLLGSPLTEALLVTMVDVPISGLDLARITCRDPSAPTGLVATNVSGRRKHPPHDPNL